MMPSRLWRQLDNVAKEEEGLRIRREHAEYVVLV